MVDDVVYFVNCRIALPAVASGECAGDSVGGSTVKLIYTNTFTLSRNSIPWLAFHKS